ncbi:MAG: amidophosphoribosyltransferase [Gallionellales bacterium 35-53-114]|jgi:predicted amidophosphoribosyltransferase|nr:MAG: amidophosphoribosyltransferase [Gallionellales bacterium 35-53-114]OYZ62730.1 MAG: amidophosphoribosyltransferase [Gallionellales bacterium 24-53-125]OZB09806.1 MAG: amidophosphoribosyltransferase [Gallionellales bacterium 39-52-133]HQS57627.1 ComF family protein [Gallionellaceae bacterium]HQS74081.1 ComF family protein [Gallionellaceae bacterium]
MEVNIEEIKGNWDLGYSLDKQTLSSTPIGPNQWGHMQFDTVRPAAGEALFQLKYRDDFTQALIIANQIHTSFSSYFNSVGLVIPMPPSKPRLRQPVVEIAKELARLMNRPCYENMLVKTTVTPAMKDIASREEKVNMLISAFTVADVLPNGLYNALLVDDLYDTGSSLEAATQVLRGYNKIQHIYVVTVTRKR